ncbi:MAG: bifunctional [glutamate--ammonia ligase]-adenylyl-L-tyrosine phosphorylase/[glutamate--ammonia-ligase] adenylyltransferase [Gemmatales bacterium]|nr:bifunctional [glutamate--ammonia ligase]-adenylyl-L-tyrosine phosphorylase/[glutamate--ammonia-ligase] adenylyltransferase [Gemmatales bacterium]MDW7993645.1 bifunctional [glutamate--ammonia ligase]-adenylyl-L-tyrosine phosphorylase/[glutamate--ammonia-ligase] adenylyltransferase [Gemmatales bacterium]
MVDKINSLAEEISSWLQECRIRNLTRGHQNILRLRQYLGDERFEEVRGLLSRFLPRCADPDMALNNLERFFAQERARTYLATLLDNHGKRLETILQIFSTSQYFSELLIAHPEDLELLWLPLQKTPQRQELVQQLQAQADAAFEDSALLRVFRRYRERQLLRIGTNDIIRERPLEEITLDISTVAEAAVEVALRLSLRKLAERFGEPVDIHGRPGRCVILAFGKLGGEELNYSSDIDIMLIYAEEGQTRSRAPITLDEFYARVVTELVRLLSSSPPAYRVDLRLRPEGRTGPLARSLASTLSYYDTLGRTWERQALIKVRPIAGDLELGYEFLRSIEPFVYRKYLSFSEINEIKAIKRARDRRTRLAGAEDCDVKTGRGGIRDIEFVIQFLQLANGGDLPEVRQRNTLKAIEALERAGCLTDQESRFLADTYRFLRKLEHRLQLMLDLQTHRLPQDQDELSKLALRMGYEDNPVRSALEAFTKDYREKTELNRTILNHLLQEAFRSEEGISGPEVDLILDPEPDPETIREVLSKYPFRDCQAVYRHLQQLAQEPVPFISSRRCRYFLARIAAPLLEAISEAPDPDMALVNLEKVTASLGAKGVLWELFSYNPPSLRLYVELCSWSQFLSNILINNPGMIDELLDTLVLNQPRTYDQLKEELDQLCYNAEDPELILHSFRDKELLRIGVWDILGKEPVPVTLEALTVLAEVILQKATELAWHDRLQRFGMPIVADGPRAGQPARYVILGLGKLGGREMSYHSDLDIILIYEADGSTRPVSQQELEELASRHCLGRMRPGTVRHQNERTSNFHFFSELAQRLIRILDQHGPYGRLYAVDMRLRPTGRSGSLVVPLEEFRRYYEQGGAQLWERQALTRARVVYGDTELANEVMRTVHQAVYAIPWKHEYVDEIASMRRRLQESRGERDLKRGFGGIVDVEFYVQLYQIRYGRHYPALQSANVRHALAGLETTGLVPVGEVIELRENYDFLRKVESRLRIVHDVSQDELPQRPEDLEKLARRLGYAPKEGQSAREAFLHEMEHRAARIRQLFLQALHREKMR